MGKNQTVVQKLCLPYCAYYKPGRNEELLCRGAVVVNRLMSAGGLVAAEKPGAQPDPGIIELIVSKLCMACEFHEHDCDFMEDRHSPACGGFVLLSRLVMSGQIAIDEIR
jgi:hypothetical protein